MRLFCVISDHFRPTTRQDTRGTAHTAYVGGTIMSKWLPSPSTLSSIMPPTRTAATSSSAICMAAWMHCAICCAMIAFDPARDRLFSVGDLVDRGEHSEQALALLDKPWFHAVLGNHEDTLCAVAEGRLRRQWWYGIGGMWAANLPDERLKHYAQRLRTLPLVRVVGSGKERFNILHAEFFGSDAESRRGQFLRHGSPAIALGPRSGVGQQRPAAATRTFADLLRSYADAAISSRSARRCLSTPAHSARTAS